MYDIVRGSDAVSLLPLVLPARLNDKKRDSTFSHSLSLFLIGYSLLCFLRHAARLVISAEYQPRVETLLKL